MKAIRETLHFFRNLVLLNKRQALTLTSEVLNFSYWPFMRKILLLFIIFNTFLSLYISPITNNHFFLGRSCRP